MSEYTIKRERSHRTVQGAFSILYRDGCPISDMSIYKKDSDILLNDLKEADTLRAELEKERRIATALHTENDKWIVRHAELAGELDGLRAENERLRIYAPRETSDEAEGQTQMVVDAAWINEMVEERDALRAELEKSRFSHALTVHELETAVSHLEAIWGQHGDASITLTLADEWLRSRKQ